MDARTKEIYSRSTVKKKGLNGDFPAILNGIADDFSINGNSKSAKGRIIATYDYTDETGKIIFQTCRFEPKDFR